MANLPTFDWDEANRAHIARHGEDRHTELGETAEGRLLLVVWTWRRRGIRVVTAFPAKRKWRTLWKRTKGEHDA